MFNGKGKQYLVTITDKKIGVSLASDSSLIDRYEADMKTAQDYYPFGMIMPGRMFTAISIPGGTYSGTTTVNGYTLPVDLTVNSRTGNEPTTYTATHGIDLTEGFESGTNDDVTAYIADTSYAGGGNGEDDGSAVAGTGKYRYGFNGKENDNEVKGVGDQIDYGMRVYDPRAGRVMSVDPLTQHYPELTPYQFASNKPIESIDLDGEETFSMVFNQKTYTVKGPWTYEEASKRLINQIPQSEKYLYAKAIVERYKTQHDLRGNRIPYGIVIYYNKLFENTLDVTDVGLNILTLGASKVTPARALTNRARTENANLKALVPKAPEPEPGGGTAKDVGFEENITVFPSLSRKNEYELTPNDLDWRGTGKSFKDALNKAFENTGVDRSKFEVTKWRKDPNGKSIPVEYRAQGGAEVRVDFAHDKNGPNVPHIGWQGPGKNNESGHILLDKVPAGRPVDKLDKSQY